MNANPAAELVPPIDQAFQQYLELLPSPSYFWQRDGAELRFIGFNQAAAEIAALTGLDQVVGTTAAELYPEGSVHHANLQRCFATGRVVEWEGDFEFVTGGSRRLAATLVPFADDYVVVHTKDVTEEWRAEDRLRRSEERLKALMTGIPDVILRMTTDGVFLDAYAVDDSMLAIPREELIGKSVADFYGEAALAEQVLHSKAAVATQQIQTAEYDIEWHNGERHRMESRFIANGTDEVLIYVRDVTERAELASALTKLAERERSAIGRELHDGLAQKLIGLKFVIMRCEEKLRTMDADLADSAAMAASLLNESIEQARDLAYHLSPLPEHISLTDALWELGRHWQQTAGVKCRFEFDGLDRPVGPASKVHIHRIAQESIANAVRHGKARNIQLVMKLVGEGFELKISDDGTGVTNEDAFQFGLGLRIMRFRARMLGGNINIGNGANGGAEVICRSARATLHD